jgi:uncharacterized protein YqjF (DUF2071 family)
MSRPIFLSARWKHLAFFNYKIDPAILTPYIPAGTELDYFENDTYVSIVAFRFERTKLLGIVPAFFYRDFEEVNLRFYVKRVEAGEIKRGVVFVSEIVPKRLLAWAARTFYKEHYTAMPMKSDISEDSYRFRWDEHELQVSDFSNQLPGTSTSFERWITEHYYGYTKVDEHRTFEYEVKHPAWDIFEARQVFLSPQVSNAFGRDFQVTLNQEPNSVFVASGSDVTIHWLRKLPQS